MTTGRLEGIAFAHRSKGNHIITSKIEHHGILHICEYLEKHHGFEVTYLDVDAEGRVKLDELEKCNKRYYYINKYNVCK